MAASVTSFQNGSFLGGGAVANTGTINGGVSVSDLYNTDYLDNKYSYNDTREGYETAYAGRDAAISSYITNIASYIANGQEDKVIAAYNQLLNEMQTQTRYAQLVNGNDDTQLRAVARQLIEQEIGINLEEFIRENTRDAKEVEKQKCYRGEYCDSTTQEELLEAMCNIQEEEGHMNVIQRGWHGFFGGIAQAWNSFFGDGKKH